MGMTKLGSIGGERDLTGGRKAVLVTVKGPSGTRRLAPRRNPEDGAEEQMEFDSDYFQTVKREYNEWREKWWREVVQNAVDAGARTIQLGVTVNEDGTNTCWCEDDAGGMPLDVFRGKFLKFGGTTKRGVDGAAGGFGKAKELIVLPWLSWSVHTREHKAIGRTNVIRVVPAPMLRGTRVEATMAADNTTTSLAAKAFLSKCDLPGIRITVDGEPVTARLRAKEKLFDLEAAEVWFNKGRVFADSYYFVRVKGPRGSLYTFSGYLPDSVDGTVIIEITKPSIDILTANRDGFSDWSTKRKVEEFISRIAADSKSALKKKRNLVREKFTGEGKFSSVKPEEEEAAVLAHIGPLVTIRAAGRGEPAHFGLDDNSLGQMAEIVDHYNRDLADEAETASGQTREVGATSSATAKMMLGIDLKGQNHLEAAIKQLMWKPDFYLINDIEDYKVPKKFYPAHMPPSVLHLAKVWAELCRFVLIQLGSETRYGVGFEFSESAAAAYMREDGHWLLLNPFVDMGKRDAIWRPNKQEHLQWLYAAAIHEATHLADGISLHNEDFAAALTLNMAKCAAGWKRIKQIVGTIRMRGEAKLESSTAKPAVRGSRPARETKAPAGDGTEMIPYHGPYEGYRVVAFDKNGPYHASPFAEVRGGYVETFPDRETWRQDLLARQAGWPEDRVVVARIVESRGIADFRLAGNLYQIVTAWNGAGAPDFPVTAGSKLP